MRYRYFFDLDHTKIHQHWSDFISFIENNPGTDIWYYNYGEFNLCCGLPSDFSLTEFVQFKKDHDVRWCVVTGRTDRPRPQEHYDPDVLGWLAENGAIDEIHYWPSAWMLRLGPDMMSNSFHDGNNNESKKYLFLCKNRRPAMHRKIFVDYLAKYDLIDSNIVTFVGTPTAPNYPDFFEQYQCQWWDQQPIFNDIPTEDYSVYNERIWNPRIDTEQQCLIEVVTPTTLISFFTEKEARAILGRRAFIIMGGTGECHAFCEQFGFKMYDEIIDYSYDYLDTFAERSEHVAKQLSVLQQQGNFDELYAKIEKKTWWNLGRYLDLLTSKDPWMPQCILDNLDLSFKQIQIDYDYTPIVDRYNQVAIQLIQDSSFLSGVLSEYKKGSYNC